MKKTSGYSILASKCICGCGDDASAGRFFLPGHDQRLKGIVKRVATEGSDEVIPVIAVEYLRQAPWMEKAWLRFLPKTREQRAAAKKRAAPRREHVPSQSGTRAAVRSTGHVVRLRRAS